MLTSTKDSYRTLDKGKPLERVGSKAANLNFPLVGKHGLRAAEGNRLHPSWIADCQ